MSFALQQEGHKFGPPSAHIFMFVTFSVDRFSLALCVSTLTHARGKKENYLPNYGLGVIRTSDENSCIYTEKISDDKKSLKT